MRHGFLDELSTIDSPVRRLHVQTKILGALALILAVVTIPVGHYIEFLMFSILLGTVMGASRLPPSILARKMLAVLPFITLMAVFLPFLHRGPELWKLAPLGDVAISREGLHLFSNVVLKASLAVLTMLILTSSTPFTQLLRGLETLRVPRITLVTLSFLYRYLFLLVDEAERLLMARNSRKIHLGKWAGARSLSYVVAVLFIRTYERGERIYESMCARGFDGSIAVLESSRPRARDYFVLGGLILLALTIRLAVGRHG